MPTIRDVARAAKVSPTAVSFVLNGRYDQLNEKTVQRVLAAIDKLNYRPSAIAKSLTTGRSGTVGVMVTHLRHPVQTFTVSALVTEARKYNYNAFIWDEVFHLIRDDAYTLHKLVNRQVQAMISYQVDGLVASTPLYPECIAALQNAGIPTVAFDKVMPGLDSIHTDWEQGSYLACSHLAQHGRHRLVYLHWNEPANDAGVNRALQENPGLELVYRGETNKPIEAYEHILAASRLPGGFDAVYVASDLNAIGVYRAVEELGLCIPTDVAVVGFDDTFASFMSPPLTSISQPLGEMGRRAFSELRKRMEGDTSPAQDIKLAPKLIVRDSCGVHNSVTKADLVRNIWEKDMEQGR